MFTFNGFLAKLKTKFSTNKTPTNNHRFPLVLSDGTPDGNATPADIMQLLGGVYITIAPNTAITNLNSMVGEQNTLFRFGQQTINNITNAYGLGRCIIIRDYAYQEIVNIGNMKRYYRVKYTPSGQTFEWPSTWKEIATV